MDDGKGNEKDREEIKGKEFLGRDPLDDKCNFQFSIIFF